ncbi:transcriptional regulator [Azorhizobium oxalatiphilum]|uniref:Transcriptional regulator n=1 Tax=Azorhizobium oxalatiphilum TaxID=980631 RepID=A0A917FE35_9HYPH|nr:Crp/Fnr family transcriptional regulator [Azorhizobium oxalatiphilum]GGF70563.1 transcriptional regulator [Azorhizobium oxalatiphilum]
MRAQTTNAPARGAGGGYPPFAPATGKGGPPPVITEMSLFRGISAEDRARIFVRGRMMTFVRDEVALAEGEVPDLIFLIASGQFACRKTAASGLMFALCQLNAGTFFGESALVHGRASEMEVTATRRSTVWALPASDFCAAMEGHPSISRRLIDEMAVRIGVLATLSFEAATLKLEARLCRTIQKLALEADQLRDGGTVRPAPTHAELASMLGTTREVVSRAMMGLARRGVIETRRQEIHIQSVEGLFRSGR